MATPMVDDFLSDHDEDLFNDYNTVATVPLSPQQYSNFVTQPTQPLTSPLQHRPSSPAATIQVRASSPALPPTPKNIANGPRVPPIQQGAFNRTNFVKSIAPPGTHFQGTGYKQQSQVRHRSQTVDFDSDNEGHRHRVSDSSDEDVADNSADIRPSVLQRNGQPLGGQLKGGGGINGSNHGPDFSRFGYTAPIAPMAQKRSADGMASAYGSARPPRPVKIQRQEGPSRAQPVLPDIKLDDINDWALRKSVIMMMDMLPEKSIRVCRDALLKTKGNCNDAVMLVSQEEEEAQSKVRNEVSIDLTKEEDPSPVSVRSYKKPGTKSTVKRAAVPTQSIAQKWATTQAAKPSVETRPTAATRPPTETKVTPSVSSPVPSTTPKPIRKRLVQGRRAPTSPVTIPSPVSAPAQTAALQSAAPRRKVIESDGEEEVIDLIDDDDDDDSGVEVVSDVNEEIEDKLLKFLNTCSIADLIDISNQPVEIAKLVLEHRPFKNLNEARQVKTAFTTTTKSGKKTTRMKEVGDRVVEVCLEMYTGYEAVDELVAKCEELGKPIAEELKNWGLNAFGASSQGELQMVELPDSHDSGIGTPSSSIGDIDDLKPLRSLKRPKLLQQPSIMSPTLVMKDYQITGLNWLSLLFSKRLSCILADDMGLGKTCQVIAFLSHLYETGVKGPHLIVVPGSTLENWLREFLNFCPALNVVPYYGGLKERVEQRSEIEEERENINVIVTTYSMAQTPKDAHFLRHLNPVVCVYDEGHALKNSESQRYKELMRIPAQFRLLLTGTPLQNNLQELISLLSFIMPNLFLDRREDLAYIFKHKAKTTDDAHTALLSEQRITRARTMMTPFILRRKKHQVLRHLPNKLCRVQYCQLAGPQQEIYDAELAKVREALQQRAAAKEDPKIKKATFSSKIKVNNLMDLRKAAIHPLLFRRSFTDATLRKMAKAWLAEPEAIRGGSTEQFVYEDLGVMTDFELNRFCAQYPETQSRFALKEKDKFWLDSGKVTELLALLRKYAENGDRALIFSQFTMAMDILEQVFEHEDITYSRLDGSTSMAERQPLIDQFYADTSISTFMLSTKAGGAGINLACANKVIIFDGSFNPQDDVQAENRAHRVGQTRDVEVVRLVCRGTVEEQIYKLGETKLALDERVAGEGVAAAAIEDSKAQEAAENAGIELVTGMLMETFNEKGRTEQSAKEDDKVKVKAEEEEPEAKAEATTTTPKRKLKLSLVRRDAGSANPPSLPKPTSTDAKDEYMDGLKKAGLDMSAA